MFSYMKFLFGAIIIVSTVSTALGIHCNICNFLNNSTCDDPFVTSEIYKHNCNLLTAPKSAGKYLVPTGCIKKVFEQGDKTVIQRSCYWGNLLDTKSTCADNPSLPHLKQLSCDVCDEDMCNSSTAIGSAATFIALCYILARIMS